MAAQPRRLEPIDREVMEGDQEAIARAEQIDRLNALGDALAVKRKRAIDGRHASGIETIWLEDEDAYDGVDDANRGEEHMASRYRYAKPTSMAGTLTTGVEQQNRSNVFLNITAAYVDGAAARVGDMLLPSDDRPWGIDPTPIPELVDAAAGDEPKPVEMDGAVVDLKVIAEAAITKAQDLADKAETRIDDWLTESNWSGEVRDVTQDCARLGTGILKGPHPVKRKKNAWKRGPQGIVLEVHDETKPASCRADCWKIYPDPGCGENVHNGNYIWERDDITKKQLRDLRVQPGYIKEQLDKCLDEGPLLPEVTEPSRPDNYHEDTPFEVWYFYGFVEREDMVAAGCDCEAFDQDPQAAIPAIITMINSRVVKAALNPLDTGAFPFDFITWKKRRGMPWGMGVARQVRTPQRMINAGSRNMMDNAGLSAGPQIVMLHGVVTPADGNYELYPRKIWLADPEANLADLKAAFISVQIECNQADLMAIIEFSLKMAEQVTGMPAIVQGQQGDAPELVGVVTIMNNNANSVLRRIARSFDDNLFEPHIERYHTYLMQHGEDEEEKGLFVVKARGSSVLVERDIQNQAILGMATMVLNPAFRMDPDKYSDEALRAQRFDPARFKYDEAQWKKIEEAASEQPQDPRIAVAQLKAQIDTQLAQAEMQFTAAESALDRKHETLLKGMEGEMTAAELTGNYELGMTNMKALLAKTAMAERNKMILQSREIALANKKGEGI